MFISYFEPLPVRNRIDLYIHYLYIQLQNYGKDDVIYITGKDLFSPVEVWQSRNCPTLSKGVRKYLNFDYPTNRLLQETKKGFIPLELYSDLFDKYNNDVIAVERFLLTEEYPPLKDFFCEVIGKLVKEYDIEGVLTIKNCPSLENAAKEYNIPVIHYEAAALRPYDYEFLMYYDYKGVNGNTSADSNYKEFLAYYKNNENRFHLLKNDEIIRLMKRLDFDSDIKTGGEIFKIGLALQIYNDSNIIAFSNGYNSENLIDMICGYYSEDDVIIRNHPASTEDKLLNFKNVDKSARALDFINKCEKIVTINSNLAYEAALYKKPVYILGQSPYEMLSEDVNDICGIPKVYKEEEMLIKLNYLTFLYMVPYKLINNLGYLRYRLTNPPFDELFNFHIAYYQEQYLEKYRETLYCFSALP